MKAENVLYSLPKGGVCYSPQGRGGGVDLVGLDLVVGGGLTKLRINQAAEVLETSPEEIQDALASGKRVTWVNPK